MARATIRDVARRAGASPASVSNFLCRPERVSQDLRSRIEAAIDELGYVPNLPARQLRRGRSPLVGVCVVDPADPFAAAVLRGVERGLDPAGRCAVVAASRGSTARQDAVLRRLEQLRPDGVVVTPCDEDLTPLRALQRRGTRVVVVDGEDPADELSSVSADHVAAGRLAAGHLLASGCRDLVAVRGPHPGARAEQWLTGAREAVAARGATLRLVTVGVPGPDAGRRVGADLARRRPDGVLAADDLLAAAVLRGLLDAGVRVPTDVAVVGYDDVDLALVVAVQLTTVRQPADDVGAAAARLVVAEDAPHRVVLTPELVVRASTRPVT